MTGSPTNRFVGEGLRCVIQQFNPAGKYTQVCLAHFKSSSLSESKLKTIERQNGEAAG
jgi:hypothetical protein